MTPLTVLYESPVVDDKTQLKRIVTFDGDTYQVRKLKAGTETVEMSGIRTRGRAEDIVKSKVMMYRAWAKAGRK